MLGSNNLSDLASAATARANLGLAAIASSAVAANITDATAAGRALLTAATAALQRTALGLAAIASSGLAADITDATAAGRALLTAATAALQRTALGLGTMALEATTNYALKTYVDAGDNAIAATLPNYAAKSANLSDLASAATARTNLGASAAGAAMFTAATAAAQAALLGSAIAVAGANLTDASATLTVAGGNTYTMPAATLSAARAVTLGTGGSPIDGEVITVIRLDATAFALTIKDDAATTLVVLPASTKAIVSARWNGTHFSDPSVQRLA